MALNGKALTALGIGSIFVWSGIKGWSVLGGIRDIITGVAPSGAVVSPLVTDASGAITTAGHGDLAGIAMQYQGHPYSFGGAPGRDGSKPWDCSSFVNFCVGIQMGRAIPGIKADGYDGSFHGPNTLMWGAWPGLTHIKRADVQASDIIVWAGHMGIAISNSQMISAMNPNDKTLVTGIDGFGNGPILCYGRLK
jgi:cell wall-associated NlpC family hydrolase